MSKIINYETYLEYFRNICKTFIALNPDGGTDNIHFYEFLDYFKGSNLKLPAMVVVPPKYGLKDDLSDNVMKTFTSEIWIVNSVKNEDKTDRHNKLYACELIIEQIIAKIRSDYKDYSQGTDRPFQLMDFNRLVYDQIGPMSIDNHYGYSLELQFMNTKNFAIDGDLWH
jgi:hypothetical protein